MKAPLIALILMVFPATANATGCITPFTSGMSGKPGRVGLTVDAFLDGQQSMVLSMDVTLSRNGRVVRYEHSRAISDPGMFHIHAVSTVPKRWTYVMARIRVWTSCGRIEEHFDVTLRG